MFDIPLCPCVIVRHILTVIQYPECSIITKRGIKIIVFYDRNFPILTNLVSILCFHNFFEENITRMTHIEKRCVQNL